MTKSRCATLRIGRKLRGLFYLVCITAAIIGCSTLVVAGIRAGASGTSAILLAAVVPIGGLVWTLSLAKLEPPTGPGPGPPDHEEPMTAPGYRR